MGLLENIGQGMSEEKGGERTAGTRVVLGGSKGWTTTPIDSVRKESVYVHEARKHVREGVVSRKGERKSGFHKYITARRRVGYQRSKTHDRGDDSLNPLKVRHLLCCAPILLYGPRGRPHGHRGSSRVEKNRQPRDLENRDQQGHGSMTLKICERG